MLPLILGAVTLGTVGYGIKCSKDEDCIDSLKETISDGLEAIYSGIEKLEDKTGLNNFEFDLTQEIKPTSITKDTKTSIILSSVEEFYSLKDDIANNSYKEFEAVISKIKNIDVKIVQIELKNNQPSANLYKNKLDSVSKELSKKLVILDNLFTTHIKKLKQIVSSCDDFNHISHSDKNTISDTMVLANSIADILNIKLVSKKDKPTKKSIKLVTEIDKVIDQFIQITPRVSLSDILPNKSQERTNID